MTATIEPIESKLGVTSPERPLLPGERGSWSNMTDIVQRLANMSVYRLVYVDELQTLLALAQLGGTAEGEALRRHAGVGNAMRMDIIIHRLSEPQKDGREGVLLRNACGTVAITAEGVEAVKMWTDPAKAVPVPAAVKTPAVLAFQGKISCFGGPDDKGVSASEDLALYEEPVLGKGLFLPYQPQGTTGTARRLDTGAPYIAMRWAYKPEQCGKDLEGLGQRLPVCTRRAWLLSNLVKCYAPGKPDNAVWAYPVDWGPNGRTNRIADVSPFVLRALGLKTDDQIVVEIPELT